MARLKRHRIDDHFYIGDRVELLYDVKKRSAIHALRDRQAGEQGHIIAIHVGWLYPYIVMFEGGWVDMYERDEIVLL